MKAVEKKMKMMCSPLGVDELACSAAVAVAEAEAEAEVTVVAVAVVMAAAAVQVMAAVTVVMRAVAAAPTELAMQLVTIMVRRPAKVTAPKPLKPRTPKVCLA